MSIVTCETVSLFMSFYLAHCDVFDTFLKDPGDDIVKNKRAVRTIYKRLYKLIKDTCADFEDVPTIFAYTSIYMMRYEDKKYSGSTKNVPPSDTIQDIFLISYFCSQAQVYDGVLKKEAWQNVARELLGIENWCYNTFLNQVFDFLAVIDWDLHVSEESLLQELEYFRVGLARIKNGARQKTDYEPKV